MRWTYAKDFDPLVLPGENLILFYNGKEEYYEVKRIHALPPFIHTISGTLAAGSSTSEVLSSYEPDNFNTVYHLRIMPVDDIEVLVKNPATVPIWAIKDTTISVTSPNKRHTAFHTVSAAATPEELYKVSQNRTAKVKKLILTNTGTAAAQVFLCDSGGNAISPTFVVEASETLAFKESELPEIETSNDIYVQSDTAGVIVQIEVEEVGAEWTDRFTDILIAKAKVPTLEVTNPTRYGISNPRIEFYGYAYIVEPLTTKPTKYTYFSASR